MHLNDTGKYTTAKGNTLVNIQTPSLAGYIPAYKILTLTSKDAVEVTTVILDTVPRFDELFSLYEMEYAQEKKGNEVATWHKEILKSKTYLEFTENYLNELIRLRFLPEDWPVAFKEKLSKMTGKELLLLSKNTNTASFQEQLKSNEWVIEDFETWTGAAMIADYYRIKLADELVFDAIGSKRLRQYRMVSDNLKLSGDPVFELWGAIFRKNMGGAPSAHFRIDLKNDTITRL